MKDISSLSRYLSNSSNTTSHGLTFLSTLLQAHRELSILCSSAHLLSSQLAYQHRTQPWLTTTSTPERKKELESGVLLLQTRQLFQMEEYLLQPSNLLLQQHPQLLNPQLQLNPRLRSNLLPATSPRLPPTPQYQRHPPNPLERNL
jgi:hypothetical protein